MPTYTAVDLHLRTVLTLDDVPMVHYYVGDLAETGGHVWSEGVHKIMILPAARKAGLKLRSKTFKGETAWMDAERLWSDAMFWAQREGSWSIY
jgi:hypothetical protein